MADEFSEQWPVGDQIPKHPEGSAENQLKGVAQTLGLQSCGRCGARLQGYLLNTGNVVLCNPNGTLHVMCHDREPRPEPLPPPATFEEQQKKLDAILAAMKK